MIFLLACSLRTDFAGLRSAVVLFAKTSSGHGTRLVGGQARLLARPNANWLSGNVYNALDTTFSFDHVFHTDLHHAGPHPDFHRDIFPDHRLLGRRHASGLSEDPARAGTTLLTLVDSSLDANSASASTP